MKRTLSLFLAIVMAVGIFFSVPFTVKTNAASVDDLTFEYRWLSDLVGGYFWQDENAYAVSGCNKSASGELVIPSTYNGKPVMEIDDSAFEDCTSLTAVTIPASITKINYDAFYGCASLKSITIPNNVTEIGSSAFDNCTSLASVTIPDNVHMYDNPFCNTAYYNNASNWVDGVLYIGNYLVEAKDDISGLCTIKAGTKNILPYAFGGCTNLTAVTIPDSVKKIGCYAFSGCTNLALITIGDSLTDIDYGAFNDTAYYDNYDNWTNHVLYVGNVAVDVSFYCDSLITIKDGTTAMSDDLLTDCEHTAIIIPESVKYIGDYACGYYCEVDYCTKISGFIIYGKSGSAAETYANENGFEFVDMDTVGGIFDFKLNDDENSYYINECICIGSTVEIPSTYNGLPVTKIGEEACLNCPNLKSVTIPESVTVIGDYSFGYYKDDWEYGDYWTSYSIREVLGFTILGTSGSQAERYAEENDIAFFDVNSYPLSLKLNDDGESYYVYDCDESVSGEVVIPSTYNGKPVTYIGDYAFEDCTSLTSVTIPDSVTEIGDCAFEDCANLTSVTIPNSVTEIGDCAFEDCTSLTSITIPNSVTYIGDYAFYGCTNLESINVSSANKYYTSVDGVLFNKSKTELVQYPAGKNTTSYTIPDSVTYIGDDAFEDCTSLTSVTIPKSVTEIDWDAFEDCENLTIYGCTYSAAEDYAIQNDIPFVSIGKADPLRYELNDNKNGYTLTSCACSYKGSVSIPSEYNGLPVTYIGDDAFSHCNNLKSVTIPKSVTKIGPYAFAYCSSLTSVTISEGVEEIWAYAFSYCNNLKSVSIPSSVTWIGYMAFGWYYDDNLDDWTRIPDFTIYGKSGSSAEKYAKDEENGFKFVSTDVTLATPKLVSISNAYNGVYLKWGAVSGADGYYVYRKTANSTWTRIYTAEGGSIVTYTDPGAKSGTNYTYTVRAYKGKTISGFVSAGISIKRLAPPKLTGISNAYNGVYLKWNAVTGASGYYVYRKTANSTWTRIYTAEGNSKVTYTDSTAKSGTNYTYTVRAYNGKTLSSYNGTGLTIKRLAPPKLVSASNLNGGIYVKWNKVTGASGYYLYRKTGNGGWSKIATLSGNGKVTYTDTTAKAGTNYTYTVRAYNGKTLSSYNGTGLTLRRLTTPKLTGVSSAKAGVTVKWNKVTGASGYYVYRKTGNGSWSKIATVSGNGKVSYLDKSAKKGTTYTYTVRAYYGKSISYYNTTGLKIKDKY